MTQNLTDSDLAPGANVSVLVEGSARSLHPYVALERDPHGWWVLGRPEDHGDSFRVQYDADEDCWYDEGGCGLQLYLRETS